MDRALAEGELVIPEQELNLILLRQPCEVTRRQGEAPVAVDLVVLHREPDEVSFDVDEPAMVRPADLPRLDVLPVLLADVDEVAELAVATRDAGGFGSTGQR